MGIIEPPDPAVELTGPGCVQSFLNARVNTTYEGGTGLALAPDLATDSVATLQVMTMPGFAQCLFIGVAGLAVIALFAGLAHHYRRERLNARAKAIQRFRNYRAQEPDGSVTLDGTTADVLDSSDSYTSHNGRVHDYVLTLFVVTPEGRHFIFKSNEAGQPFLAPLTRARAKLVLKAKYREAAGHA